MSDRIERQEKVCEIINSCLDIDQIMVCGRWLGSLKEVETSELVSYKKVLDKRIEYVNNLNRDQGHPFPVH